MNKGYLKTNVRRTKLLAIHQSILTSIQLVINDQIEIVTKVFVGAFHSSLMIKLFGNPNGTNDSTAYRNH